MAAIRMLTGSAQASTTEVHASVHMSEDEADWLAVALGAGVRAGELLAFLAASTEHAAKMLYLSAAPTGTEALPAESLVAELPREGDGQPLALWVRVQQQWEGPVAAVAEKASRRVQRTPSGSYVVRSAYDGVDAETGAPKKRLSHTEIARLFGRWSDWDNAAIKGALLEQGVQRASVEGTRLEVTTLSNRLQLVMLAQQVFDEAEPMPARPPERRSFVVREEGEGSETAVNPTRRLSHAEISLKFGADEYDHRLVEVDVGQEGHAVRVRRGSGGVGVPPTKAKRRSFVVRTDEEGGESGLFKESKKALSHAEISLLHGSDEYSHRSVTIDTGGAAAAAGAADPDTGAALACRAAADDKT